MRTNEIHSNGHLGITVYIAEDGSCWLVQGPDMDAFDGRGLLAQCIETPEWVTDETEETHGNVRGMFARAIEAIGDEEGREFGTRVHGTMATHCVIRDRDSRNGSEFCDEGEALAYARKLCAQGQIGGEVTVYEVNVRGEREKLIAHFRRADSAFVNAAGDADMKVGDLVEVSV